jgi:glucokinase
MSKQKISILSGDIGGTNSRLSLLKISSDPDEPHELIDNKYLFSFNYLNAQDLLTQFLAPHKSSDHYPRFAVFGVPGPIKNNTVLQFTNVIHWGSVNGDELAKDLRLEKIVFMNDFVANGYGIQTHLIEGKDLISINNKPINPDGPKATLGPGTGLGVGYLTKQDGDEYYLVSASEGSHGDFAPRNKQQFKFMKYLQRYYGVEHISTERATCGQSIIPIYKFLSEETNYTYDFPLYEQVQVFQGTQNSNTQIQLNGQIIYKGLRHECQLSEKTLEFFCELYGQAAGNICLSYLPTGGLYLLGGVSGSLQNLIINTDIWRKAFLDKGRMSSLLEDIPIFLVKVNDLALRGTIEYCRRYIEKYFKNQGKV